MTRSLVDVDPVVRALLGEDAGEELVAYVLSVFNALADPREVLDQHAVLGWDAARISARLHASVVTLAR